ncbi:nicotinate-nucleotide--dimethylbenzimidazole phosphoribosyltransferase [Metabacillus sp. RGM 3146]|uniref:nicotinate-nucleotide--dimethylbenzimidazole phosphoribosyltransferase n=1 Tax=Metabacillus sp. RGM 3146 TaxID=3401092 RepID=UPI003B9C0580
MKLEFKEISSADKVAGKKAAAYIDTLTKPPGSLGRLEELAIQLAEITSETFPSVTPPGVLVFAGDHGIVEEGVSAFPQEVTGQMILNFLNGGAAINVFSRQIGALFNIVDVGSVSDIPSESLINRKVRKGTRNFLKEDAMSKSEAEEALLSGYEEAEKMIHQGTKCLIPGEMGIGNTTSSSAILAVLSGKEIEALVGKGTGIQTDQMIHKQKVVKMAIEARNPDRNDPLDILAKLGGFEIAGMAGAMLAAAAYKIPILVDGFISTTAALIAQRIEPNASDYMIVGHQSAELGHAHAVEELGKAPILDLNLRLGEGSGAALAYPILHAASLMIAEMATFENAGISGKN